VSAKQGIEQKASLDTLRTGGAWAKPELKIFFLCALCSMPSVSFESSIRNWQFFALAALRSVPHRKRHQRQAGSQFLRVRSAQSPPFQGGSPVCLIPILPKYYFLHRLFYDRRKIIERVRTLVLIKSQIANQVVGIGAQFVGEISDGIVVAEGNEKIDVLKQNY
jgi:hypothetical protein